MSGLLRADEVSSSQLSATPWSVHQRAVAKTGDVVCVSFAYGASAAAVTAPDGTWTAAAVANQSNLDHIATFYKTLTAAGPADYAFNGTPIGRPYIGYCAVVAGAAPVVVNNGGTGSTAAPSPVTPPAGSLVLALAMTSRLGSTPPDVTAAQWRRRCSGFSGVDTTGTAAYFGVYAIDSAAATPTPALSIPLPTSAAWVAQTLTFAPNAQPAAATLSDSWTPYAGSWLPMAEAVPVSGAWV